MAICYLGIGSNLGDRNENVKNAIRLLEMRNVRIILSSSIIETKPEDGPPDQSYFLNACLKIETNHSPDGLLAVIHSIEKELGRIREVVNGPRTIDIDILLYDNVTIETPRLTIPHPRMFQRNFVLIPLKEIAPEVINQHAHAHN